MDTKGTDIKITRRERNGKIEFVGAVTVKGKRIECSRIMRLGETEEQAKAFLRNKIIAKLPSKSKTPSASGTPAGGSTTLEEALDRLRREDINASWSESTFKNHITYFRKRIPAFFAEHGGNPTQEDVDKYRDTIRESVSGSKKSRDISTAQITAAAHLAQIQVIYDALCAQNPGVFPTLIFKEISGRRTSAPEQCKALPDEARVKLMEQLRSRVGTNQGGTAMGLMLMLLGGLRTSEATAVHFSDITRYDTFATVNVIKQERNGKLDYRLKTDAAYRSVPLPYIGLRLIEERIEYLKAQGVSERDIDRMPCVCRKNSIYEMALSKEVSKLGRELIAKCVGRKSNFLANAETAMKLYPDLDDDTTDLAAYVLRRDYCTRASNICGIDPDTIDYLLGHKNGGNRYVGFPSADTQRRIAEKLERYVFDPDMTLNPAFRAVSISETNGELLEMDGYTDYQLRFDVKPETKLRVKVVIRAVEPNDIPSITLPTEAASVSAREVCDRYRDSKERIIIGKPFGESCCDTLRTEAAKIKSGKEEK